MKMVAVLGLGPVGLATVWELLQAGHHVHAYDTDAALNERLRQGHFATDLSEVLLPAWRNRQFIIHSQQKDLPATTSTVICVGTPWQEETQSLRLDWVMSAIASAKSRHLVLRSTFSPGTIESQIQPQLPADTLLSYYPEFLREAQLLEDLLNPPLKVAAHSGSVAQELFNSLFPKVTETASHFATAETLKIASNAFHALKVTFANEIAALCQTTHTSAEEVMRLFCADTKLNISGAYLKPGAPFGGRCLEKDVLALSRLSTEHQLHTPLIAAIHPSNEEHKKRCT